MLVALVAFPLSADNVRRAGQTSGALLRLGGNARAYGLGEAYGAIDDFRPSAFYYNPAAASFNRQIAFDMLHGPLVTPIFYDSLAGVVPIGTGAIGIGLQYLSYGKFEEIDNTGALTGDSFSPNEMLGRIVYGTPFHGTPLKLGIGVKYLASKLYTDASTLAGDAGVLYATPYGNLGVSYQNFGKGLKFIKDSSPLPAQMRASAAIPIPFYPDNLITLGTVVPRYGETSYQAGLEFHIKATREFSFYPRAGYNSATAKSKLGSNAGYSAGMGFEFLNFALDYAYVPLGEIGDTHRVSLSYRLGARIRSEEPEKGKQETSAEGGSA
ncbi:MAG: PorV/PorQ family protein [Elusimicrobia bacterium]|nr:PorV/PorQ family protein [Elusimicrobiota bacterium]